ncbi:MAG: helix-hairpin-helix domain-containing protein [Rhodocyclaceae bacterium]|nr:helix-hairpin-helix domain-containing protein [Rhodocyclaceae bacterium]
MSAQLASLPLPFAHTPVVRFNGGFGYRLDGDQLELNADLALSQDIASPVSLQLWACDGSGQPEHAVKVGECAVPAINGAWGWSTALPPAGRTARTMVMALTANGEIQDLGWLPQAQVFVQPRLSGGCGYRFDGDAIELSIDTIENPRNADNLSGNLNLELWALTAPYTGGAFEGVQVAQACVGRLNGAERLDALNLRVPATQPPAGRWYLVLMLREWSAEGFVTRDFTAFEQAYEVAPAADLAPVNTVVAEAPVAAPVAKLAAPTKAEKAAPAPKAEIAAAPVKTEKAKPVKTVKAEKTEKVEKAQKAEAPAKAVAATDTVSINTASVDELAKVKGMTRAVAKAIVAGRPYGSVDELVRIKGLGEKSLAKLRGKLAR